METAIAHDGDEEIYPLSHGTFPLIEDGSSDGHEGLIASLAHVSLQAGSGQTAPDKPITAAVRAFDRRVGIEEGNLIRPLH